MKLTPVTKRRLHNFKSNKRALYSLYIFLTIFIFSLFAEFIANDKPLLVIHNKKLYFPVIKEYSEIVFGSDLDILTDYHDPFISELIEENGRIFWTLIPYKYDTIDYKLDVPAPAPPSKQHWLGTDDQGHDVIALIIYGFRISVLFGITLTVISSIIGITVGAIQGYFGGITDLLTQRFIEVWGSIPTLFLIIIITAIIEPTFGLLLLILLAFSWLSLVSVVRAEFLRTRNFEYVKSARALGVSHRKIMFKHILPNALVATFTFLPFILNGSIIALTSLDFLGFGLSAGSPSLGRLLAQGKSNLHAPHLGISAFFVLAIMLSLLIFVGEGVRDAFDSRKNFV
ncbi:hypothetical protein LCGC14_1814330 [marine sediment metagenome]|uniref:ABC transmembrane type-1 domain-containing protein n=1 Tax=marine sediment metagenome TaxID=412755 RepID=A0A0F9J0L3_9ZZZZ